MRYAVRAAMVACMFSCAATRPGLAQTYTCLPDTAERVVVLRDYVVRLVTEADTALVATRIRYQLPKVAASKVTVVTSASICANAGNAYHAAVTSPGTAAISRTLVVLKVGSTRYVVTDPSQTAGEFQMYAVFDSKWKWLAGFAG